MIGHVASSVPLIGWAGVKNGELLRRGNDVRLQLPDNTGQTTEISLVPNKGTHKLFRAAVLPSLGVRGLNESEVLIMPFKPLADYGRSLVLHWNGCQMRRRDVKKEQIANIAACLRGHA